MKRTCLLLLLTLALALPCVALAEDMPVIVWETPAPTPSPTPTSTPTPTPEPEPTPPPPYTLIVPWREIDWANDGAAHYFIILSDERVGDADTRALMLWLQDTYGIPSMAYTVNAATLDARLKALTADDVNVAGVLIYGYYWLDEALKAVEYCQAQSLPLWVSTYTDGDDMIYQLNQQLDQSYPKMN